MTVAHVSQLVAFGSLTEADDRLFKRVLISVLATTIILAMLVSWVNLPPQERSKSEKLPPQLTRVIEQKLELEKTEPEVIPEPTPEPEPEPEKEEPKEPVPPVEKEPEPVKTVVQPDQTELADKAREKAKESGLMALTDDLADMRDSVDLNSLADTQLVEGAGEAAKTERNIIAQKATETSGGINTSNLSQDAGGGNQLAGRKTTEYAADEVGLPSIAQQSAETEQVSVGSRSQESIRKVFDQNKGAIYAIYRRALRKDPSLEGKVTINIVIDADGSVQKCEIIESELESPALERKLLARIKLINFGKQDVSQTMLNYSFNFLPF